MKYEKLWLPAMLAMLCLSLVVVANASAILKPEFLQSGSQITPPIKFEGKSNFAALETKVLKIECKAVTTHGEANGAKTVAKVIFKFTSCAKGAFPCQSGAISGEIVTEPLKGRLGGLKSSPNEVGLLLEPEGLTPYTKFKCPLAGAEGEIYDQVIARVTPIDKEVTQFLLVYECKSAGVQELTLFEGETEPHHLVFFYPSLEKEDLCLKTENTNTWLNGAKVEIHS
jgi:hypothetical protein